MGEPATKIDPRFGHRTLDPLPTADALTDFYERHYYALIDAGKLASDIGRTRRGGDDADLQRLWLRDTLHRDIADAIAAHAPGKRVLDVGSGMGLLLADLRERGFAPEGLDPAPAAIDAARGAGFLCHQGEFLALEAAGKLGAYDAITFCSVLSESFDPAAQLAAASRLLAPGGVAVIRAANQFNPLQEAAVGALGMARWWIARPAQVHYFTYESVAAMLAAAGLNVVVRQSDFPMEMFLLMGLDYVNDPAIGAECHKRRVAFELNVPAETRRTLYGALAQAGMGRCMLVVGQKPA